MNRSTYEHSAAALAVAARTLEILEEAQTPPEEIKTLAEAALREAGFKVTRLTDSIAQDLLLLTLEMDGEPIGVFGEEDSYTTLQLTAWTLTEDGELGWIKAEQCAVLDVPFPPA